MKRFFITAAAIVLAVTASAQSAHELILSDSSYALGVYRLYPTEFKEQGIRSKLILQVHDEIIVDLVPTEREVVERIVREQMEGATKLSIPLVVDIGVGKNWLEAH